MLKVVVVLLLPVVVLVNAAAAVVVFVLSAAAANLKSIDRLYQIIESFQYFGRIVGSQFLMDLHHLILELDSFDQIQDDYLPIN